MTKAIISVAMMILCVLAGQLKTRTRCSHQVVAIICHSLSYFYQDREVASIGASTCCVLRGLFGRGAFCKSGRKFLPLCSYGLIRQFPHCLSDFRVVKTGRPLRSASTVVHTDNRQPGFFDKCYKVGLMPCQEFCAVSKMTARLNFGLISLSSSAG